MPIKTVCPECDRAYTLADAMEGKSVKCKGCGQTFTVEPTAEAATAIAARPSRSKAKAVRPADDDDAEIEAPKKGGAGKVLLIGGAIVAVLALFVCGGVGVGGFLLWRHYNAPSDSPTASENNTDKPNTDKNPVQPPEGGKKITLAKFQQIKGGMPQAQVEGILGPPDGGGPGNVPNQRWSAVSDWINVTYYNGKVQTWSATIDGTMYGPLTDPNVGPGTDPNPATKVTKANFDMIRGGLDKVALQKLLGVPTQPNAKPDTRGEKFVSAKGSAQVWQNGLESITVLLNPDGKAAAWKASFVGQAFDYKTDPLYVVKPEGDPGTKLTKDSFNQIKGGMSELDVHRLLGRPTDANAPADPDTVNYDKAHTQLWQSGADSITVTFCNKKAARWVGTIGGEKLGPTLDQASVMLKNATAVTKANYDKIVRGTPEALLVQTFGQPTSKSPVTNHPANKMTGMRAHTTYHYKWSDGQGGDMTIHFINFGTGGVVDRKEEFRLK